MKVTVATAWEDREVDQQLIDDLKAHRVKACALQAKERREILKVWFDPYIEAQLKGEGL